MVLQYPATFPASRGCIKGRVFLSKKGYHTRGYWDNLMMTEYSSSYTISAGKPSSSAVIKP